MSIYISENAFISLTLSAIETSIVCEANGILLGYIVKNRNKNRYFIENAIPYQLADRTETSSKILEKRRKRLYRVFLNYTKYDIIGEYHTHPNGTTQLSNADKEFIKTSGYNLEIVISITKDGNTKIDNWRYKNNTLLGNIDKYNIQIAGWQVTNVLVKHIIRCPYAVGFSND